MFNQGNIFITQNNNNYSALSKSKAAKKSTKTMTADRNHHSAQNHTNNNYHGNNDHNDKKQSSYQKRDLIPRDNTMRSLIGVVTSCQAHRSLMTITILTIVILSFLSNGFITQQVEGASVNTVGKYKSQRDRGKLVN